MSRYEYKVIPAPRKGKKSRSAKSPEDRFALALATAMNELGADGWEYVRADALPAEEKSGWLSRSDTVTHHVLVFRRTLAAPAAEPYQLRPAQQPPAQEQPRRPQVVADNADPVRFMPHQREAPAVAGRHDQGDGVSPRLGPARSEAE